MKIIGHRGARGTSLENSLASIRQALAYDIDGIEFDIHRTRDDVLVVMHDATTKRTGNQNVRINDVPFAELRQIRLQNGQTIPTLEEVLQLAGSHDLYIDIKDPGTAPLLIDSLRQYPRHSVTVVSRLSGELQRVRSLRSDIPTYLYFLKAEHPIPQPIHMVRAAKQAQASGLGLDKVVINPLTYWLAGRSGLKIYSYPFKTVWGAWLYHRLYPRIDLMTSHPEKINHHSLR